MLEIAFAQIELRDICEDGKKAEQALGVVVAEALRNRIADFLAADHVTDLLVGNPQSITSDQSQIMSVDLPEQVQILFCANHKTPPTTSAGEIDWSRVSRIKILAIGSGHV